MPTVIATVGAADANSYETVVAADSYFGDSYGRSRWALASQSDREALMITASRSLDQYMSWSGRRSTDTQSMEFPREGAYDRSGNLYPNNVIPTPVRYATFELAYYMLENGGALSFADQTVDRVKVSSIEIEFSPRSTDVGIPDFIENMLNTLGDPIIVGGGGKVQMARLIRT